MFENINHLSFGRLNVNFVTSQTEEMFPTENTMYCIGAYVRWFQFSTPWFFGSFRYCDKCHRLCGVFLSTLRSLPKSSLIESVSPFVRARACVWLSIDSCSFDREIWTAMYYTYMNKTPHKESKRFMCCPKSRHQQNTNNTERKSCRNSCVLQY